MFYIYIYMLFTNATWRIKVNCNHSLNHCSSDTELVNCPNEKCNCAFAILGKCANNTKRSFILYLLPTSLS